MRSMKRILVAIFQVLAALSVCALVLYLAELGLDFKWNVIGGMTLLLFGSLCYRTRDLWAKPRYWATFGGLLVIHCAMAFLLQRNFSILPLTDYAVIGIVEATLLLARFNFGFNAGGQ